MNWWINLKFLNILRSAFMSWILIFVGTFLAQLGQKRRETQSSHFFHIPSLDMAQCPPPAHCPTSWQTRFLKRPAALQVRLTGTPSTPCNTQSIKDTCLCQQHIWLHDHKRLIVHLHCALVKVRLGNSTMHLRAHSLYQQLQCVSSLKHVAVSANLVNML